MLDPHDGCAQTNARGLARAIERAKIHADYGKLPIKCAGPEIDWGMSVLTMWRAMPVLPPGKHCVFEVSPALESSL